MKRIPDKQMSIPGLPTPEPKTKKPTIEQLSSLERLTSLESRMLALELEVSLLKILMEQGDKDHA